MPTPRHTTASGQGLLSDRVGMSVALLTAAYLILSFFFAEKLEANNGLGWDGRRYASLARLLWESPELDAYLIMRVIPSIWVNLTFNLLGIEFSPANIIRGFEAMNLVSVLIGVVFTSGSLVLLGVRPFMRWVAFGLMLTNYAMLKFTVYYPVMTDSAGFALGAATLYFYLRGNALNLGLTALLSLFIWPAAGFMAVVLLLFPRRPIHGHVEMTTGKARVLRFVPGVASFLYVAGIGYLLLAVQRYTGNMAYTLPVDHDLAVFSVVALGATAIWWSSWLNAFPWWEWSFWRKAFSPLGGKVLLAVLTAFLALKYIRPLETPDYANGTEFFLVQVFYGFVRPFITIVSHTNYYGVLFILLIVLHRQVCRVLPRLGFGFALALVANLMLFGMKTESRMIVNLLSWLTVMVALAMNSYSFRAWMLLPLAAFNILTSKLWMPIGDVSGTGYHPDGTMTFPFQKFFMNIGPWMSDPVWRVFFPVFLVSVAVIFLCFFSVGWRQQAIVVRRRFRPMEITPSDTLENDREA
jgi:hypothetical protein